MYAMEVNLEGVCNPWGTDENKLLGGSTVINRNLYGKNHTTRETEEEMGAIRSRDNI